MGTTGVEWWGGGFDVQSVRSEPASPMLSSLQLLPLLSLAPAQVLELQSRLEAAQHRERAAQAEAERLR